MVKESSRVVDISERDFPQVDISMEECTQQSRKKRKALADTLRASGRDDSINDNGDDSEVLQPPSRKRTVAGAQTSHVRRPASLEGSSDEDIKKPKKTVKKSKPAERPKRGATKQIVA
jgi:hypothetical protein